jgi:cobalamin biosynthesis Mg chelatase CobN
MDSLSTNPDEKQPDQSQPASVPAESAPAPEPTKAAEPAPAVNMPDEASVAATPKIDLANPGAAPETEPVMPPPPPAQPPKKDLAGYEATDVEATQSAEARPTVMAQTAKPRRSPWMWVVLAVVILAALAGGGYWYLNRSSNGDAGTASPSPSSNIALTSPTPSATPVASATPSPSETPSPTPSATPAPSASPAPAALTATVGGGAIAASQSVSVSTNRPVFSGNAAPGNTVTLTLAPENIGISINPATTSAASLSQTGDPVAYVSLLAALVLILSLAGLRLVRRRG